ncbi:MULTISPECIES: AlpA family transcriptional regulator [unclassified Colwellia]|uniref:helix-turn-helix transcriptional regulator n=1 Tax=unclassified Colwellia TaxID=196834 RepID=UPI0015F66DA8|nr:MULTISPECIES: AlpA family phage regulatory protein [unclassified Colwellia]MBA6346793.1 AlpA family phage regulatory protein [Colwellia sp. BRX8-9]MBA6385103.1 AlpA family phage regulatory protein [Colwellia sp. BRX10-9]MBA6395934.1 AlpA family phage regulatory protein [Colwellia sp. BRX10-6]
MSTPKPNVVDPVDQINEYKLLNFPLAVDKLKLIRKTEVLALTCMSKSTLHLKLKDGLYAPSISIGDRAVAFIEYEVLSVISAQIQGRSKEEIRLLVKELVAQRQNITVGA